MAKVVLMAFSETDFTEDRLEVYPGGSHSLGDTAKDLLNADLLAFARG